MPTLSRPVTLAILVMPIAPQNGASRFCVSSGVAIPIRSIAVMLFDLLSAGVLQHRIHRARLVHFARTPIKEILQSTRCWLRTL